MHKFPCMQDADLKGKIVLVRVDHNVVKKGEIHDPFRIDASLGTLFKILSKGGKPILMTHVSRPRDKKTGRIDMNPKYDVKPIVDYLYNKLQAEFIVPEFKVDPENGGYFGIDDSINDAIVKLKQGEIDGIYLPNVRWFKGEETKGVEADNLAKQMAALADVFVNDAFGSWQPHTSTAGVTNYLPSYAGHLLQKEIDRLDQVFSPTHPMLAVIAGSKFDTKIGPLSALLKQADNLIIGGVIYNAFLCAKYDIQIAGIAEEEIETARKFYELSKQISGKLIEPPFIVESDTLDGKIEGKYRIVDVRDLKSGTKLNYVLDVHESSFDLPELKDVIRQAKSIFVNAVMGFTPHFGMGTRKMYSLIDKNTDAYKMYGGGDTLQEFRQLLPGEYMKAIDDPNYYFFSGGGTILKAINEGQVTGLAPVQALINNMQQREG